MIQKRILVIRVIVVAMIFGAWNGESKQQPSFTPEELLEAAPRISELLEITNAANREINFYGRVVDQNGEPVPNATVNYQIPTYKGGISPVVRNLSKPTGADGSFILEGESGTTLIMRSIEKPGYTFEKMWGKNYFFLPRTVGEAGYKSDSANPVLFKAWKKTEVARGLKRGEERFTIPASGETYTVKLPEFEKSVRIAFQYTNESNDDTSRRCCWKATLSVNNGGLIESDDPLMYEAPESGYQPSWETSSPEHQNVQKRFYLAGKNGQVYGRMEIYLRGYYGQQDKGYIRYSYVLNPTGSRNLLSDKD